MQNQLPPRPLVIAHRGASGLAPENTSLAVATAIELGADMVEVDVRLTRDGQLVIFHDQALGRTARLQPRRWRRGLRAVKIADLTLAEIKQLDAGSWKGPAFAGLAVPTLSEILSQCAGRIALNLELKVDQTLGPPARTLLVNKIGEALRAHQPMPPAHAVLISSTDSGTLQLVRQAVPDANVGVLVAAKVRAKAARILAALHLAKRLDAYSLHLPLALTSPALIGSLHHEGFKVFVYTVNRADRMRRLLAAGADGIFTNHPERLSALLAGKRQETAGEGTAAAIPPALV